MMRANDASMTTGQDTEWMACDVIRYAGERAFVIRVCCTGAVIPIRLNHESTAAHRATALHPLRPVQARVRLGPFERDWFTDCEIDFAWDTWDTGTFPPPSRYSRKRKTTADNTVEKTGDLLQGCAALFYGCVEERQEMS